MDEPAAPPETTHQTPHVQEGSAGGRRRPGRVLGSAVLTALLGFGGGVAGFAVADQYLGSDAPASATQREEVFQPTNDEPAPQLTSTGGDAPTPREVYRQVAPSVVHIDARISRATSFLGIPTEPRESQGTGSGFVIDDDGHIVTNAHVVEDAQELEVSFGTDATAVPAKLVGADRSSDIAVIKVDPDAEELRGYRIRKVPFGDSAKLQVGDPVLAIGNPFGLDRTLTTGVVSALQREIPALNEFRISDVIQTDAAVNPGNSGGPLLDAAGRVVGVNSQIQSRGGGFDGVAFAVPSSRVQEVARQLIEDGEVRYAWLGVAGGEVTPALAEELDLEVEEGVLVGTVTSGSPADKAGLRGGAEVQDPEPGGVPRIGGDILLSFDGEKLTAMRQLADMVDARKPGDRVEIDYLRGDRRRTTTVTLGERPDSLEEE